MPRGDEQPRERPRPDCSVQGTVEAPCRQQYGLGNFSIQQIGADPIDLGAQTVALL